MPWESVHSEKIAGTNDVFNTAPFNVGPGNTFAEITFSKSAKKSLIKRLFNKVDNYFSYVGGLVGTIVVLFFVMSFYT